MISILTSTGNYFSSYLEGLKAFFVTFTFFELLLTLFDILIVALLIYYLLVFIRGTNASKIVYGILLLLLVALIGRLLNLETLNWVLRHLTTMVVVAIPIVFQPELRRALEKLGRKTTFGKTAFLTDRELARLIQEILKAVRVLKMNHVGGLIVFGRKTGLNEYIESGVKIGAEVTSELILNLFFPNSPLHDGAIIIKDNKVVAASCVLPLTESRDMLTLGTRHRAAVGITEVSDAVAIVVSEERGSASLIKDGKISKNIDQNTLEEKLVKLLKQ